MDQCGSVWLSVVSKDFKGYLFVNIFCLGFVVLAQCGSVWLGVGQCGSVHCLVQPSKNKKNP